MGELIKTLDTDLERVKAHTRLLVRAREWTDNGDRSRLLRGRDLRAAEAWLADGDAHPQAPPTSGLRARDRSAMSPAGSSLWIVLCKPSAGVCGTFAPGWYRVPG